MTDSVAQGEVAGARPELSELAKYLTALKTEDLPDDVVRVAKYSVLDNIGVAAMGARDPGSRIVAESLSSFAQDGPATVIGRPTRTTAFAAALANGAAICGTELSEGVSRGTVHPGTVVVPAALAVAEETHAPGTEFLAGVVAGYESVIRIGWSIGRDQADPLSVVRPYLLNSGWFPPSLLGGFGSAIAAGRVRGMSPEDAYRAWGVVAGLAPTSALASFSEGAMVKAFSGGWASALGVYASVLAAGGLTGLNDFSEDLFLRLVKEVDRSRFVDGLGERFEIRELDVKFFAVGPARSELDCALQLREKYRPDLHAVSAIQVETNRRSALLTNPGPDTGLAAKFSVPYCVAQALMGKPREDFMDVAFSDEAVAEGSWRRLAELVEIEVNDEFGKAFETYPQVSRPSKLTVTMRDGSQFVHSVKCSLGLPGMPASDADYERKFRYLAGRYLPEGRGQAILDAVRNLESMSDVGELTSLL